MGSFASYCANGLSLRGPEQGSRPEPFLFNHQVSPEQAAAELGDGRLETRPFARLFADRKAQEHDAGNGPS
jgi:hypothetical protein